MSNFMDDRHALYVGWVFGLALKNDLDVTPVLDDDGNYTDRLQVNLDHTQFLVTLVVPYPPADWTLDERPPAKCAACGSENIYYDPADGWCCADCQRTDADE